MIILVSFYYLFLGLVAGYVGDRFGKSKTTKIAISLVSAFIVFLVFLVVIGVIFKLKQYKS